MNSGTEQREARGLVLFCFSQALRRLRFAGRGAESQQLVTQDPGDAPGQEEGCPWPSPAGEPHSYVDTAAGVGMFLL